MDRARLRRLLGLLGSDHDGEVLNAARLAHGMLQAAGLDWAAVIPDESPAYSTPIKSENQADLDRLEQLLTSPKVSDVLKLQLGDMRGALLRGRLSDADRRMLRLIHRKAVLDGSIVEL